MRITNLGYRWWGVLSLCLLSGCVSTSVKWYKPGATKTSFSQDKEACDVALLGAGDSGMPKQVYTFEGCMERKGWQKVPASAQ